jgi:hypothetical protein
LRRSRRDVIGYQINADAPSAVREVRQAWFCVPMPAARA